MEQRTLRISPADVRTGDLLVEHSQRGGRLDLVERKVLIATPEGKSHWRITTTTTSAKYSLSRQVTVKREPQPAPLRLPAGHARDWLGRCEAADLATVVAYSPRTVTLDLPDEALADLIADAIMYAEEMSPDNTGDIDYRPKARTLLRALERLGVTYTRRPHTYTITVTARPMKEN